MILYIELFRGILNDILDFQYQSPLRETLIGGKFRRKKSFIF